MEGKEILAVVDSVSSEKGLEKDVIFVAMELAIASASQRHFHEDAQLIVEVDRESGEFITKRQWEVLDENDEEFHRESHISSSESSMDIGELYSEQVDNVTFGRIETQAARQVMLQKVREAEKELVVSKFMSSDNSLVSGFVKRVTRDNIIVDLGQDAEAILPRDQILPGEIFKINDRVRAVLQIKDIEGRGLQLMLSRICTEIVTELLG
jgi:N utilization substance protein A